MKLLELGYSVRTTVRPDPEKKRDLSFLTNLPGASEKLQIFTADLSDPDSFEAALEGCNGVLHVATPVDFEGNEPEEVVTQRTINGTLSILNACSQSKTVKRVVYTSSASAVVFNGKNVDVMDERFWSDVDYIRTTIPSAGVITYLISKTSTERAALQFAEENGLDLVTLIPSYVVGPFICPKFPGSVCTILAMVLGNKEEYAHLLNTSMVHVDDVARAHIFLLEYPEAKGSTSMGWMICLMEQSNAAKRKAIFSLSLGASEKLQIFNADLSDPDSFEAAIEGCTSVLHVATPVDFEGREPEEVVNQRAISGTLGILKACLKSKTIKRVVYTSSASTVEFSGKNVDIVDENFWSDVDYIRKFIPVLGSYMISKTLTERAALQFAEEHGLDLVTLIPSFVVGPFICPKFPSSVRTSLAMVLGNKEEYAHLMNISMVHVDDVARAHIFLLEYPEAKGSDLEEIKGYKVPELSSRKLLDTGFKYKYGLDEMFDGAIQCCKEKGYL
ncbi:hypothetical protein QYF36_024795 [Acer negundo]|nr:hypothetical protein QYF36_024795 [Acer negundo]